MHNIKSFPWTHGVSKTLPILGQLHSAGCCLHRPFASIHAGSCRSLSTHAAAAAAPASVTAANNIETQSRDEPASSGRNRKQKRKQRQLDAGKEPQQDIAEDLLSQTESLRLLEWPEVCQQVLEPGGVLAHELSMRMSKAIHGLHSSSCLRLMIRRRELYASLPSRAQHFATLYHIYALLQSNIVVSPCCSPHMRVFACMLMLVCLCRTRFELAPGKPLP